MHANALLILFQNAVKTFNPLINQVHLVFFFSRVVSDRERKTSCWG